MPAVERIGHAGVNHMALLADDGVFNDIRRVLGMACEWGGAWTTSLGELRLTQIHNDSAGEGGATSVIGVLK